MFHSQGILATAYVVPSPYPPLLLWVFDIATKTRQRRAAVTETGTPKPWIQLSTTTTTVLYLPSNLE